MKLKVFYLQSHPIQYFSPLFQLIEKSNCCDFQVLYCSNNSVKGYMDKGFNSVVRWDTPLLEGYKYRFFKNFSPFPGTNLKFYNLINPGIFMYIIKHKPDVVWINGWSYLTIWLAIIAGKFTGAEIWLKSESPYNQEIKKSRINQFMKKVFLQYFLFKIVNKFFYIGEENRLFYLHYNVSQCDLVFSPYCVNNKIFADQYSILKKKRDDLRRELNINNEDVVILYSGKLVPKKRPLDLLKAVNLIKKNNIKLIFLGDGVLKSEVENLASSFNMSNVFITGFVNQTLIGKYYTMADIFVLPSTIGETWGLVINEAMNFELPVVASQMVGSVKDLVKENINGFSFPVGNVKLLSEKLKILINSKSKREEFGKNSKKLLAKYSYSTIIKTIETCLRPKN